MDEQHRHIIDEATAGLSDDPELRLDIRAELASHLGSAANAYEADGHSTEESAEMAVKDLGSPDELASELLAANARRMKWRAQIRMLFRVVVVPASMIIALVIASILAIRLLNYVMASISVEKATLTSQHWQSPMTLLPVSRNQQQRYRELAALLSGNTDATYQRYARHLLAQWQAHRNTPEAAMYYAQYANNLLPRGGHEQNDDNSELSIQRKDLPAFTQAMRVGQRLEPENALYDFRLAEAYLTLAIEGKWHTTFLDKKTGSAKGYFEGSVVDRQLMELGLRELQSGLSKRTLKHYHRE